MDEFSGNRLLLSLFSGYLRRAFATNPRHEAMYGFAADFDASSSSSSSLSPATVTLPTTPEPELAFSSSALLATLELLHRGRVKTMATEEVKRAAKFLEVEGVEEEEEGVDGSSFGAGEVEKEGEKEKSDEEDKEEEIEEKSKNEESESNDDAEKKKQDDEVSTDEDAADNPEEACTREEKETDKPDDNGIDNMLEKIAETLNEAEKSLEEAREVFSAKTAAAGAEGGESEADTDVADEDDDGVRATPDSPDKEVFFRSILGKIVITPPGGNKENDNKAGDDEEMEVNVDGESSRPTSPLVRRESSAAAARLLKEISETLPLHPGFAPEEDKKKTKDDEEEKTLDVLSDSAIAPATPPSSASTPKPSSSTNSRKRRRSSTHKTTTSPATTAKRRRRYRLRINTEDTATFRCKRCGYWSFRRAALANHQAHAHPQIVY